MIKNRLIVPKILIKRYQLTHHHQENLYSKEENLKVSLKVMNPLIDPIVRTVAKEHRRQNMISLAIESSSNRLRRS